MPKRLTPTISTIAVATWTALIVSLLSGAGHDQRWEVVLVLLTIAGVATTSIIPAAILTHLSTNDPPASTYVEGVRETLTHLGGDDLAGRRNAGHDPKGRY